jgi:hypothetical protein
MVLLVGDDIINDNGTTYASWNWKAGGQHHQIQMEVSTSSVQCIIQQVDLVLCLIQEMVLIMQQLVMDYLKTRMVIIKARENTSSWVTWHKDLTGSDYCMFLDGTDAQSQYSTILKNQSASLLTLGTNSASNANTQGFISYNFHSVQGYSKFGSYTGNGSTDGTFVYTGFKPAFVIMKRTDTTENWLIKDSVRDSFNVADKRLFANLSQAEGTSANGSIDILSNGFKQRGSDIITNASSGTYIYMAFASSPFTTSSGVPTTAR